jgi:hypothetical protein
MKNKKAEDRIQFLKDGAIKKVFHRREAKLWPEDFLPAVFKDQMGNALFFDFFAMPKDYKFKLKVEKYVEIFHANGLRVGKFDCFEKAQYLLGSITKDRYVIAIPKNKRIVKLAMKRYEAYWEKKVEKLVLYFMGKNGTRKIAEAMAEQVICDLKVPKKWNELQAMIQKQKGELGELMREFEQKHRNLKF